MDIHAMKLQFLEEFIKLKDESVVKKLIKTLNQERKKSRHTTIDEFAGTLTDEDARIFLEASQECRKIDINEW